ncbi:glucan biosynthesis protein [Roseibacterium sp. SDUM158017]|uniref:glucan biosynthesis protein n=1 Tax=Roseicyclus salinarum TaxID=3036773 RepID=UPI0024154AED|nr:glucan biosynthesis protein [Roseibacterium sp. SDUM158017]MDG4647782.1 glucan biosynthesis protein [Roseibacterium sp. SDUM158017]
MRRRHFLGSAGALLAAPAFRAAAQTGPLSLLEAARALAAQPYRAPSTPLPPPFAGLDYDAYRGIRPLPGRAALLPHGPDYAVDLLPPGLFFPDPVRIELSGAEGLREVPFSPGLFSFDPRYFGEVPPQAPGAGFSGLRLRHPLNAPDAMDEVLVAQGASYFRAIGRSMVYGLSARAVALGTGGPSPEEFPRFTQLRLHQPRDGRVRLEGVIDGPSLAGHIEMELAPGAETVMRIAATILPRREIADIGIAPLTSMYLKGPLRASVSDDFRPRVHDSDLLFIENGAGERLWRPISNPARLQTSAFVDESPVAFGLHQTARSFEDYEDTEARYHERPNAVVRPEGGWGRGAVVLVEIPTGDEFMDNIVAFWRPETPLGAGSEHRFDYRLTWTLSPPEAGRAPRVLQTRSGREHDRPGTRRYVIDVSGPAAGLAAVVSSGGGAATSGLSVFDLPGARGARVTFLLTPGDVAAADLRLSLRRDGGASSVWLHRWTRARDGGV